MPFRPRSAISSCAGYGPRKVPAPVSNAALATQLTALRRVAQDEEPDFDALRRLVRRTAELLTAEVSQWSRATRARPLSLPG